MTCLLAGCHDDPSATPDAGFSLPPPAWAPCSLITGGTGIDAECAEAKVPLDWSDPGGRLITYFVKRYRPAQPTHGDLWMIAGGPGQAGDGFESAAKAIAEAGHVDVYLPDHRGTGRSSRLTCAMAEQKGSPLDYAISTDEMKQCLVLGGPDAAATLAGFTTSNAARDIGWMVSQTRVAGRAVDIYGVSYGTYLTLRYIELFPDGADGIVLDSLCAPGTCFLSRVTTWTNTAGNAFFAACGQDAFCRGKLGTDPWAQVGAALDRLDANSCPEAVTAGFTRVSVRSLLNVLVSLGGFNGRALAPALVYRIGRCSAADRHALTRAGAVLFPPVPDTRPLTAQLPSQLLTTHLGLSELYESPPPSVATQQQIYDAAYVASDRAVTLAELYDGWPRYPADPLAQTWPSTTIPILVLRGGADYLPAADAELAKDHYAGPHQSYVVVPRAQHHLILNSPTTDPLAPPCGQTLVAEFADHPNADLDLSCVDHIQDYGFPGDPTVAMNVFGTPDTWEGDPGP